MTDQTTTEPTIDSLAVEWFLAKAAENKANGERLDIEVKILAMAGFRPEGSETTKTDAWKLTTTGKLNRKLDVDAFDKIAGQIPPELHPVKITRTLDETGFKWLKENRADLFALIVPCVTTTPAKPAVKCEPLALGVGS